MTAPNSRPVGAAVDSTPAGVPQPVMLTGRFGTVERLDAARHGVDFWRAMAGHDALWTYLPDGPFTDETRFAAWLKEREQDKARYCYAVVERGGHAVGVMSLMEFRPAMRVIEIGYIVYSPLLQRTPLATEAQYLIARYAFETLGYRRYEWKCDALNAPSRHAALRFGFTFEGIFRQHMIVKGRNRDTAWFSMLDSEWPARKTAFERWLKAENFTAGGKQIESLGALNSAAE
jgi:RimJ/RimL family protein N-acetyltransferase